MNHCGKCGKLMASGTGEPLCRACREEASASADALMIEQIDDSGDLEIPVQFEVEVLSCVRCGKHPAVFDSHFCAGCKLALVNALGDAAEELFRTPPAPDPDVSSPASLMHDLEGKRQRTATSHMRLVGGTKLR
jgi:hypothetical protein